MKAVLNMARRCVVAECEHEGGAGASVISIDSTHVALTRQVMMARQSALRWRMGVGVGADADVHTGGHGDGWPFSVGRSPLAVVVDAM